MDEKLHRSLLVVCLRAHESDSLGCVFSPVKWGWDGGAYLLRLMVSIRRCDQRASSRAVNVAWQW